MTYLYKPEFQLADKKHKKNVAQYIQDADQSMITNISITQIHLSDIVQLSPQQIAAK